MICAPSENPGQSGHPPSLIRVFAGRMKNHWAFYLPKKRTTKTLIRLGGCSGWSESSLDAQLLCWFCRAATKINRFYNTIISTRPPTLRCQFLFSHLCYSNPYIRTHAHTTPTYVRTHIQPLHMFARTHSPYIRTHAHTAPTYVRTHTQPLHTYARTHARTHTHTHKYSRANFSCKCSKRINLSRKWHFESKNKI